MFTTIIVGTDGSANAEDAVTAAAEFAAARPGTTLHIISAYKQLTPREMASIASDLPEEFRPLLSPDFGTESKIRRALSICRSVGVEAEAAEVDADPTDALLAAIEAHGADLVVVGSRGEGRARRALHGSVSTNVLHHAPCSVLVVKSEH